MNPSLLNCTAQQLRRAADLRDQIDDLERELAQLLGEQSATPGLAEALPKRRFSAATIAKMRAAQRARWAARKSENTTTKPQRARRRLSAAARARLSEVAKARWKKAHAAGKSTL